MSPRSFDHWYRGASVETASLSSTSTPWGLRGSLIAPVIRAGSDWSATGSGGLQAGGSSSLAANLLKELCEQTAVGGSALPGTAITAEAVTILEIMAAADAWTSGSHTPAGGGSLAGFWETSASIAVGCEAGVEARASADVSFIMGRASEWILSSGGMSQITSNVVEVLSSGFLTSPSSTVIQALAQAISGGSSLGGVGMIAVNPPGRSFKYRLRESVLGDVGPRRGDFATGFRGWLGIPSSGKVGGAEVTVQTSGGLVVGGSAGDANRVDALMSGVAAIGLCGTVASTRQIRVEASGGEASLGGVWASRIGTSFQAYVGCAVGGGAGYEGMVSELATARWSTAGGTSPRLNRQLDATSVVGFASAASPHISSEVEPSAAASFGASALANVDHLAGPMVASGTGFGGGAREDAICSPIPNGGIGAGGAYRLSDLGVVYRIYSNGGLGAPIDYSLPIAELSGLEWTSDPLPSGSSFRFGVRAYDQATGLQEENLDASASLVLDDAGRDATRVPRAPIGLRAIDLGGGRIRLEWTDGGGPTSNKPTSFSVYITQSSIGDFSSPIVVPAAPSRGHGFATEVGGLVDGRFYAAVVRARNAHGEEGNVTTVYFTIDGTPPSRVDGLTASVTAFVA